MTEEQLKDNIKQMARGYFPNDEFAQQIVIDCCIWVEGQKNFQFQSQLTEKDKQIELLKKQRLECERQFQEKVDVIAELEAQIEELQEKYDKLKDHNDGMEKFADLQDEKIDELEAQIDKMKCCGNCGHYGNNHENRTYNTYNTYNCTE